MSFPLTAEKGEKKKAHLDIFSKWILVISHFGLFCSLPFTMTLK